MTLSSHSKVLQQEEKLYHRVSRKVLSGPRVQGYKRLEVWVACWDDKEGKRTKWRPLPEDVA